MAATYCVVAIFGKRGERKREKEAERERGRKRPREEEGKRGREREEDLSCPFSCTVKVDVLFFNAPTLSHRVLYGDRLRAANGTETRSNATARWTVRIEIWSRGEWCYGSILYKWYVSVILFGRLEKDRSREFIIPRADVFEPKYILLRNLLHNIIRAKRRDFRIGAKSSLCSRLIFIIDGTRVYSRSRRVLCAACKIMKIYNFARLENRRLWIEAHKKIHGRNKIRPRAPRWIAYSLRRYLSYANRAVA